MTTSVNSRSTSSQFTFSSELHKAISIASFDLYDRNETGMKGVTIDVTTENAVNVTDLNDGPDCSELSPERQVNKTLIFSNVSLL